MTCQRCQSERVLSVWSKCSDMYTHTFKGQSYEGYVPGDTNLGAGDL